MKTVNPQIQESLQNSSTRNMKKIKARHIFIFHKTSGKEKIWIKKAKGKKNAPYVQNKGKDQGRLLVWDKSGARSLKYCQPGIPGTTDVLSLNDPLPPISLRGQLLNYSKSTAIQNLEALSLFRGLRLFTSHSFF